MTPQRKFVKRLYRLANGKLTPGLKRYSELVLQQNDEQFARTMRFFDQANGVSKPTWCPL